MRSLSIAPATKQIKKNSAYFDPGAGGIGLRPAAFVLVAGRTVPGLPVFLAAAVRAAADLCGYHQPGRRTGQASRI